MILTLVAEGAALPLAALTSACGLYARLRLPEPWLPATEPIPLVIYGASSAVGSYAIQLANRSNIHPLICISGKAQKHVEAMIDRSKGDTIIDYRNGDEAVVKGIKEALKGAKLYHAFDAVSEKGSYQNICQVLEPNGKITLVLPGKDYKEIPETVQQTTTTVGSVHEELKDFGYVHSRYVRKYIYGLATFTDVNRSPKVLKKDGSSLSRKRSSPGAWKVSRLHCRISRMARRVLSNTCSVLRIPLVWDLRRFQFERSIVL